MAGNEGNEQKYRELELILREWKTVIQTQMHFNDMIMRTRTNGLTVVMAVYGAAAFSLQYRQLYLNIFGLRFHVAAAIILFGIGMLFGLFAIDYGYYYKMLIGAVERSYKIDDAFKGKKIAGFGIFGMSREISKAIGKPNRSKTFVVIFYLIPIGLGFLYLLAVLLFFDP